MAEGRAKIWIDLANSPHVLFFEPLIGELERGGADVVLTSRAFAQTVEMAAQRGLHAEQVGGHGGRTTAGKAFATLSRAAGLMRFARRTRATLAVSHNSYAQALAARAAGIPYVTLMDYEHTPANHVSFRLASKILLPSAISPESVRKYGATRRKTIRFDGFKEQVYLDGFLPNRSALAPLFASPRWDERCVLVVARPPADFAIYHRFENPVFDRWLDEVGSDPEVRIVLLPRTPEQRRALTLRDWPSVIVPEAPLDGPNLLHRADLVASAGGTMNREAAVLGVPSYSFFAGRPAQVDLELNRVGRLEFVRAVADLANVRLVRKKAPRPLENPGLVAEIATAIRSAG